MYVSLQEPRQLRIIPWILYALLLSNPALAVNTPGLRGEIHSKNH